MNGRLRLSKTTAAIGCSQGLMGNVVRMRELSAELSSQRTTFPIVKRNTRRRWTPFCRRRLMPHEYVADDLRKEVGRLSCCAYACTCIYIQIIRSCAAGRHFCINETRRGVSAVLRCLTGARETFHRRGPTRCPAAE